MLHWMYPFWKYMDFLNCSVMVIKFLRRDRKVVGGTEVRLLFLEHSLLLWYCPVSKPSTLGFKHKYPLIICQVFFVYSQLHLFLFFFYSLRSTLYHCYDT